MLPTRTMPFGNIIRRTKSMRLRKPGLDSSNCDQTTTFISDLENAKVVEQEHGKLDEAEAPGQSQVRTWHPCRNGPSDEFDSNSAQYPDDSLQSPSRSLPSSPTDVGSSVPPIGIALGHPEADAQFIKELEVPGGYTSKADRSVDSSAAVHIPVGFVDGTAMQKGRKWASFAGHFGTKYEAVSISSEHRGGRNLFPSSKSYPSNRLEAWKPALEHALPETSCQCYYSPEKETSDSFPRAILQQSRLNMSRKPSTIRKDVLSRKISWRRNPSRKSQSNLQSSHETQNSRSPPLSPSSGLTAQSHASRGIVKKNVSSSNLGGVSLLHVDIPHAEMERYSVMFSNLLEAAEAPSLVARSQGPLAKLAKLELASETGTKPLQSRMLPRPVQPTVSPNPPRTSVALSPDRPSAATRSEALNTVCEGQSPLSYYKPPDPPSHPKMAFSDSAGPPPLMVMIHRASESNSLNYETVPTTKLHLSNIPNPPTGQPFISSSSSSSCISPPSRSSSLPTHPSSTLRSTNPPPSAQKQLQTAIPESLPVEISIARQISISNKQRHVVVPIVSRRTQMT